MQTNEGFSWRPNKKSDFEEHGIPHRFKQDNYSHSVVRGVLRGLHYQKDPKAQGKLILAVRGAIFDVAVDIRKGSPSYGKWVRVELTGENHRMLYVPAGFAHGFAVLSAEADVMYRCTEEYAPEVDRDILWNDSELAITWPIDDPLLSSKDQAQPLLKDADNNFEFHGDDS